MLGPSFGLCVVIAAALMDVGVFVALRFLDFDFLDLDLRLGVAGAAGSITCGFSTADACRGAILGFGFEYVSTTRAKASLFDWSLSRCCQRMPATFAWKCCSFEYACAAESGVGVVPPFAGVRFDAHHVEGSFAQVV